MRFTRILGLLIQASIFQGVLSAPTADVYERGLVKRYTGTPSPKKGSGGPAESDYPTDDEIRAAHTNPSGPAVFFSGIPNPPGSTNAYQFAQSIGGHIFRGAFPLRYTNQQGRSQEWYQNFADRFSGVFAEKASGGTAYLVAPFDQEPDDCRVWTRIEFPTLQDNPAIFNVILVDYTNWDNRRAILGELPGGGGSAAGIADIGSTNTTTASFEKRQIETCLDWDGDGDDPNGDA